jgi:hypothetical protein
LAGLLVAALFHPRIGEDIKDRMNVVATRLHSPASVAAMKAIQVQKTGGPEVLTMVDLPGPEPKSR